MDSKLKSEKWIPIELLFGEIPRTEDLLKSVPEIILTKELWDGLCKKYSKKGSLEADWSVERIVLAYEEAVGEWGFSEIIAAKYPNASAFQVPAEKVRESRYQTLGGVLYSVGGHDISLVACPPGRKGTFKIPYGVDCILPYAFHRTLISGVEWPEGVEHIDAAAFSECDQIELMNVPESVLYVGDQNWENPFENCHKLTVVNVDVQNPVFFSLDGLMYKKTGQLLCCPAGKRGSVTLPDTCTAIGSSAFAGCGEITEIKLSPNNQDIAPNAFSGCEQLKHIYFYTAEFDYGDESEDPFAHCSKGLCIHGIAGGSLERYANEHGFEFEALKEPLE